MYRKLIQKSIKYIENNLSYELTIKECSKIAGYSEFYYQKIFKGVTGLSVAEYIRKRRLSIASKLLLNTDLTVFEIAFDVGFNSIENFSRAFKKEHGITASDYRSTRSSLHLLDSYDFNNSTDIGEPDLVYFEGIAVHCEVINTNHKNRHTDIPKHWNNYHKKYKCKLQEYDYGLLKSHTDNSYSYWIGRENLDTSQLLVIPAGWYLKFNTSSADAFTFVESIHKAWEEIYRYLDANNIVQKGPFAFERYIEASKTFSEEIFIPVEGEKNEK